MKQLQMLLITTFLLPGLGLINSVKAQSVISISTGPSSVTLNRETRLPGTQFKWETQKLPDTQKIFATDRETMYSFSESAQTPFTGLAIGWEIEGSRPHASQFKLDIRSRELHEDWPEWVSTTGYIEPDDSPSGLYWAMLYVTPDGKVHDEFEVRITVPENSAISFLKITAADARSDLEPDKSKRYHTEPGRPEMPDIINREGWWGNLPPGELQPDYTPQQISITHSAIHHTVTANEPPDPAQVVRQIWDWHVNDNGWLDIGYNFIIDHTGNIYQGRYNPWLETTDVRGAHAGNANSQSVGIGLLGQFEPGANPQPGNPASLALDALVNIISWRFGQNGIDPLGSGPIQVNPGGTRTLPNILGHRDVSATACPGENLYTLLPQIRNETETGRPDDEDPVVEAGPFELKQNYPNPFRGHSTIPFVLEESQEVTLYLYTVRGDRIRTLYNGNLDEGEHELPANLDGLSSGVYYYELTAGDFKQMKQMVYIR